MKGKLHSATIFPFLSLYRTSNPDVDGAVQALMMESNIKTSDPFGDLPAGTSADSAIGADKNKGAATEGANDLETLYLKLPDLVTVLAPNAGEAPKALTPNSPTFCINHNLAGANSGNGLGMTRRFTFTANYTGWMVIRAVNKLEQLVPGSTHYYEVRDDTGAKTTVWGFSGAEKEKYFGVMQVVNGRQYSMKVRSANPKTVFQGSQCGYKMELARVFSWNS